MTVLQCLKRFTLSEIERGFLLDFPMYDGANVSLTVRFKEENETSCVKAFHELLQRRVVSCPYSVSILSMKSLLRFRDGEHWEYAVTTKNDFTFVDNATLHNHNTRTRNHLHSFNAHGRIYLSITIPPLDTELLQLRSVDAFKSNKMRLMPVNIRPGSVPPNFHVN